MIKRSNYNRELLKRRVAKRKQLRQCYLNALEGRRGEFVEKPVPPQLLEQVKREIRERSRQERKRSFRWTLLLSVIPLVGLVFLAVWWLRG